MGALRAGLVVALFATAALASLTSFVPVTGRIEIDASTVPASAAIGTSSVGERPGTTRLVPFDRLVGPFRVVPTGEDGEGRTFVALAQGSTRIPEIRDFAAWSESREAAFLDADRINGDGLLAYFPPGFTASGPYVITYRAKVTTGAAGLLWAAAIIALLAMVVHHRHRAAATAARRRLVAATAAGAAGAALLALNLAGLWLPLRSADAGTVFGGAESRDRQVSWLEPDELERQLAQRAGESREDYAARLSGIVSANMVHLWNHGNVERFSLHVPPWSNFILWAVGEIDRAAYRYHYIAWRPALERGAGMCAQITLALVDLLREKGYDARIVQLGGHTVVTAEVAPGKWFVFDPDKGATLRHALPDIERNPGIVRAEYERAFELQGHKEPKFAAGVLVGLYGPEGNHMESKGANQMMGTFWAVRETFAHGLKWLLPLALLACAALLRKAAAVPRESR